MTSTERALNELRLAGLSYDAVATDPDTDISRMLGSSVAELLAVFAKQGHSGSSASMVASLFYRLVRGEVLAPLTGAGDEWMDVSESSGRPMFQNKRCFSIFATDSKGSGAYNVQGRLFINKDCAAFSTSEHSSTPVEFPCIPVTEYIREGTPEAEAFKGVFDDKAGS